MQRQIVALDQKTRRGQVFHAPGATVDRKHTTAVTAVEVMVMVVRFTVIGLAQRLVARGLARQIDAHDFVVLQQALQLPINR
ncbi:hypothetical protein ABIC94_002205 [Variovorax paradoxus]